MIDRDEYDDDELAALIDAGEIDPDEIDDIDLEEQLDKEDEDYFTSLGMVDPISLWESKIEWVPVKGFSRLYEVNREGQVRSIKSGKLLKQRKAKSDYWDVGLSKNGKAYKRYVHILTWESWNPKEKIGKDEIISHEDGNFDNCDLENFSRRTRKANAIISHMQRSKKHGKTKSNSKTI